MIVNPSTISSANDTLSRRRQISASQLLKRQREVYSVAPEIEDIGYEITACGAEFTMANLAKQPQRAQQLKEQMKQLEEKRKALLVKNNFAPDYLSPVYFCQKCKDKGFIGGKICTCMQQEIAKQRQNSLSKLSPAPQTNFEIGRAHV